MFKRSDHPKIAAEIHKQNMKCVLDLAHGRYPPEMHSMVHGRTLDSKLKNITLTTIAGIEEELHPTIPSVVR